VVCVVHALLGGDDLGTAQLGCNVHARCAEQLQLIDVDGHPAQCHVQQLHCQRKHLSVGVQLVTHLEANRRYAKFQFQLETNNSEFNWTGSDLFGRRRFSHPQRVDRKIYI
jgi:hypothetical protein